MNPTGHESIPQDRLNNSSNFGSNQVNNTSTHPIAGSLATAGNKATHGNINNHHNTGGLTGLDNAYNAGNNLTGNHTGNHNVVDNLTSNLTGNHNTGLHSTNNNLIDNHANNNVYGSTNPLHTNQTDNLHKNEIGNHHNNGPLADSTHKYSGLERRDDNLNTHNNLNTGLENKNTVPSTAYTSGGIHNSTGPAPLTAGLGITGQLSAAQIDGLGGVGKTNHTTTNNHHLNNTHHNDNNVGNPATLGSTNSNHLNHANHNYHNGDHVVGQNNHSTYSNNITDNPVKPSDVKPSKIGGTLDKLKGSVQETLGKVMNNHNMVEAGIDNKLEGQAKIEAAKLEKEKQNALH